MFVVLGQDGKIAYSTDGKHFDPGTIPNGFYLGLTYGNGLFVAVGTNVIAYSTDGKHFDPGTIPSGTYRGVAYGKGMYVIVGDNKILYSESIIGGGVKISPESGLSLSGDGTLSYTLPVATSETLGGIKVGTGLLITEDGTLSTNISANDITGLDEELKDYAIAGHNHTIGQITNLQSTLAGKQDKLTAGQGILIQNNTISSTVSDSYVLPEASTTTLGGVKIGAGLSVTDDGILSVPYEAAGVEFTLGSSQDDCDWQSVAYGNGMFVAISYNGKIATSTDGKSFTLTETTLNGNWRSIVYGDDKFIVVGRGTNTVACSKNGIDFEIGTIADGDWYDIAFGNGMFVAVGDTGTVWSEDGKDFKAGVTLLKNCNAVCYGNGLFVALGNNGRIIASKDGKNFNTYGTSFDVQWWGLAYGNDLFVAISWDTVAYSKNGIDFQTGTIPNGHWKRITYGNGMFVAISSNGTIAYSTNGKDFKYANAPTANWGGIIYGNSLFVVVGFKNRIGDLVPIGTTIFSENLIGSVHVGTSLTVSQEGTLSVSSEYLTKSQLIDLFYPVGSIYTSTKSTSPQTVFGVGTWKQIVDRFLYCTNSGGKEGGSKKISVEQLPAHNHALTCTANPGTAPGSGIVRQTFNGGGEDMALFSTGAFTGGCGAGEDYMPPYYTVYAWERTG